MEKSTAQVRADEYIKLMIQYQPNLFGTKPPLYDSENAKLAAQALAALRLELIEQLTKQ